MVEAPLPALVMEFAGDTHGDCMVALPGLLFFNTQIPACLWFLSRNKAPKGFPLSTPRNRPLPATFRTQPWNRELHGPPCRQPRP
jgi:hypothetical protein